MSFDKLNVSFAQLKCVFNNMSLTLIQMCFLINSNVCFIICLLKFYNVSFAYIQMCFLIN